MKSYLAYEAFLKDLTEAQMKTLSEELDFKSISVVPPYNTTSVWFRDPSVMIYKCVAYCNRDNGELVLGTSQFFHCSELFHFTLNRQPSNSIHGFMDFPENSHLTDLERRHVLAVDQDGRRAVATRVGRRAPSRAGRSGFGGRCRVGTACSRTAAGRAPGRAPPARRSERSRRPPPLPWRLHRSTGLSSPCAKYGPCSALQSQATSPRRTQDVHTKRNS